MRSLRPLATVSLALSCVLGTTAAQRHDAGSSPPTAPPPPKPIVTPQPILPMSSGLGALQLSTVKDSVSAPQSLATEVQSSDDRLRATALAAISAPGQYLNHGHIAFPHSVRLDFVALGNTSELDAILTVELDQHIVSAILTPENEEWQHISTVIYPTAFTNPATTPFTFLHTARSLLEPQHYTAIFHATTHGPNGDYTENEAHLRILNAHAVVTMSFASTERTCDPAHQHPCDLTERWLQPDATDPQHRFLLVSATGHVNLADAGDPIAHAETFETAHLRTFSCQPFTFSETSLHFEPTANPAPCTTPHDPPRDTQHEQPLH